MEIGKIRDVTGVIVLPPREGFSPGAIGAVGMMVRLLAAEGDIVVGGDPGPDRYTHPRLVPVRPVFWCRSGPIWGRTDRYMEAATRQVRALEPRVVEVHNRANLALKIARAVPDAAVTLFVHNDPQGMRLAKTPAQRATILRHMQVVCVSGYLRDRFMDGVPPGMPPGMPPGVPPGLPGADILANAIDLSVLPAPVPAEARDKMFLFVGRTVADKGVDAFVRAFGAIRAQLPGWEAAIIGADRFSPGSPETRFTRTLIPAARAAGVALHGYQPHPAILRAMSRAAIVVVPSRWQEPFGLTALEALASGAALICSPHGGLPEVAGRAAMFAPPDPPGCAGGGHACGGAIA